MFFCLTLLFQFSVGLYLSLSLSLFVHFPLSLVFTCSYTSTRSFSFLTGLLSSAYTLEAKLRNGQAYWLVLSHWLTTPVAIRR